MMKHSNSKHQHRCCCCCSRCCQKIAAANTSTNASTSPGDVTNTSTNTNANTDANNTFTVSSASTRLNLRKSSLGVNRCGCSYPSQQSSSWTWKGGYRLWPSDSNRNSSSSSDGCNLRVGSWLIMWLVFAANVVNASPETPQKSSNHHIHDQREQQQLPQYSLLPLSAATITMTTTGLSSGSSMRRQDFLQLPKQELKIDTTATRTPTTTTTTTPTTDGTTITNESTRPERPIPPPSRTNHQRTSETTPARHRQERQHQHSQQQQQPTAMPIVTESSSSTAARAIVNTADADDNHQQKEAYRRKRQEQLRLNYLQAGDTMFFGRREMHPPVEEQLQRSIRQAMDDEQVDKCRLFTEGEPGKNELYSPDYPNNYPKNINCTRVITAPKGQIIRLDFRNSFHIEEKEECKFDFLEIRDGQYGFSNLIGKYCGTDFPPEITSKERYLWLHFHSDESIEYSGFTAVYEFIDRSREAPSTDLNCTIEKGDFEGFINSTDVPQDIKETVIRNKIPLDCMWRIQVQDKWKIQLKFFDFKLSKPNDCETNFLDIFPEETVMPLRIKNFCGSAGEGITSESNILHMRFYAEQIAINSTFSILYTAFRDKGSGGCTEEEYDCEDATCISRDLECNGRDNCKFRWDEENCDKDEKGPSEHVVIIIIVFGIILGGMVITFLVNCVRKIMHDQKIIREHIRQSRESKLDELSRQSKARSRENISMAMSPRQKHSQTSLQILDDVSQRYYREVVPISVAGSKEGSKEKEHTIMRHDMIVQTSLSGGDNRSSTTTAELPGQPMVGACDMGCQTRESLFATLQHRKSIASAIDASVPPPPRFSTFGYDMQHMPPPPPPASATAPRMRHSIRIPQASVDTDDPRFSYSSHQAMHLPAQLPPPATFHQMPPGGSAPGRPQEICHHHHQHQQHLQKMSGGHQTLPHRTDHQQQQHQHKHQPEPQTKITKIPLTVLAVSHKTTPTGTTGSVSSGNVGGGGGPGGGGGLLGGGKGKQQQQKGDESKVFVDIRNSAPDVIIMTSH